MSSVTLISTCPQIFTIISCVPMLYFLFSQIKVSYLKNFMICEFDVALSWSVVWLPPGGEWDVVGSGLLQQREEVAGGSSKG